MEASIRYSRTLETERTEIDKGIDVLEYLEKNSVLSEYLNQHVEKKVEVLATYATLLRVKNRKQKAIEKCEQALDIVRKNSNIIFDPAYTAHAHYELSVCKYQLRRRKWKYLSESEKEAKKALRIHNEYYGEGCVESANDYIVLGYISKKRKKISDAISYSQKAYEIRLGYYGEKNLYTTNALEGYALILSYDSGQRKKAEENFLKALQDKKEFLPADSEWIGYTYQKITQFYLRNHQWKKAILYGVEALKRLKKR